MAASLIDEEWAVLSGLLPTGWRESARTTGAIRRARGITDPDTLLRLLLLHVSTGLSLRSAAARAGEIGLAQVSDVALLKRLRSSEAWLRELSQAMFGDSRFGHRRAVFSGKRRFRAVDATTVEEPGATGTDWRVHYSIVLPEMRFDYFEVTDNKGGETFTRFPIAKGDVLLADRGYSQRAGAAHVLDAGGDVLVRLNTATFPLVDLKGRPFNIVRQLRKLPRTLPGETPVEFIHGQRTYRARFCGIRKTRLAAERAKERLLREASKKGKRLRPETLEAAEYVFVLTSLPQSEMDCAEVLELYRARWQIELVFKRLKSLLSLGHLPKYSNASSRAWLQGKLLTVLLIERLLRHANFFSPWGFDFRTSKPLA
jgi:hypothetical protein